MFERRRAATAAEHAFIARLLSPQSNSLGWFAPILQKTGENWRRKLGTDGNWENWDRKLGTDGKLGTENWENWTKLENWGKLGKLGTENWGQTGRFPFFRQ